MRKGIKIIVWTITVVSFFGVSGYAFYRSIPEPPLAEIESARLGLAMARDSQAAKYSAEIYQAAEKTYDSAMTLWRKENERFVLRRNYEQVQIMAMKATDLSAEALESTRNRTSDLENRLHVDMQRLFDLVKEINLVFSRFPLPQTTRTKISKGKLLLNEANVAYKKQEFLTADELATKSGFLLYDAHKTANNILENYFENYPYWKRWLDESIAESREKSIPVVVVDKFARKCYVYKNGQKTHEFEAELGKNWVGDKRYRGDYTTPEGRYKITVKKEKSKTIYYKALLINFPNEDDIQRFRADIANGKLPRSAKIGGLIEIHGHGGKGADWTQGCVALSNPDMDVIYRLVSVGTPVTIIGSAVELKSALKN